MVANSRLVVKHTATKAQGRQPIRNRPHRSTRSVLAAFGPTMDAAIDTAIHLAAAELADKAVEVNLEAGGEAASVWEEHFAFIPYVRDLASRIVAVCRRMQG